MSATLAPEPASKKKYTADDLLKMPDGDRYELVDGELVERSMGAESGYLAGTIFAKLREFVEKNQLGWVFPDGVTYQCYPNPKTVRRPDVSFIKNGRLPKDKIPTGHIKIAPDIAVEVISPSDTAGAVDAKVEEYLDVRVALVWIVHPQMQIVRIHRLKGTDSLLRGNAVIEGDDVLPGFRLSLKELFESLKKK